MPGTLVRLCLEPVMSDSNGSSCPNAVVASAMTKTKGKNLIALFILLSSSLFKNAPETIRRLKPG